MHEFWHTETTFWLRGLDVGYERLPDYHGGERRPDPSGQRQPTWPPFRPPDLHEFWHTETTFWLRGLDVGYERLPDYHGGERRPDPSGQRQPSSAGRGSGGDAPQEIRTGRRPAG